MSNWTVEEWTIAIEAYLKMQHCLEQGDDYNKLELYRGLSTKYPHHTIKAWEYRMQNISAVLDDMGWPWIDGLKPARNVEKQSLEVAKSIIKLVSLQNWISKCQDENVVLLCKRLSDTDSGKGVAHQGGIYLSKEIFFVLPELQSSIKPNPEIFVNLRLWSHPNLSDSIRLKRVRVIWYKAKKNEIRMTQFGGNQSPLQHSSNSGRICLMYFKENSLGMSCNTWLSTTQEEDNEIERILGPIKEGNCYLHNRKSDQLELSFNVQREISMIEEENKDIKSNDGITTYPEKFYHQWIKGSRGTVRKPFQQTTGRPLGKVIETSLIKGLQKSAQNIREGVKVPKIIMIVGGAGNGKSDALESFLRVLFQQESSNVFSETLEMELMKIFNTQKRRVNLDSVVNKSTNDYVKSLHIQVIQDATWGSIDEQEINQKASELLANDILNALKQENYMLLCCVNRGKLFQAANFLSKQNSSELILSEIINQITKETDRSQFNTYADVVELFVSDRESLLKEENSVFEEILNTLWTADWDAHFEQVPDTNPIEFNKLFLQQYSEGVRNILLQSEVASKSHWTFRGIFAQLGYWLTVDKVKGIQWQENWTQWLKKWFSEKPVGHWPTEEEISGFALKTKVYIQLNSLFATLPQLIFPIRTSLRQSSDAKIVKNLLEKEGLTQEQEHLQKVIDFFMEVESIVLDKEVEDIGFSKFCLENDPAQGAVWDGEEGSDFRRTIRTIEDMFSQSIEQGIESVINEYQSMLQPIEINGLCCLKEAQNTLSLLTEEEESEQNLKAIHHLTLYLLKVASNITKRAICVRKGYVYNYAVWKEYEDIFIKKKLPNDLENELKKLIGEPKHPNHMLIKESDILSGVKGSSNYSFGYFAKLQSITSMISEDDRLHITITRESDKNEELEIAIPYTFSLHRYLFLHSRGGYVSEDSTTLKATIMELKTKIYKNHKGFTPVFIVKDSVEPDVYYKYNSNKNIFHKMNQK